MSTIAFVVLTIALPAAAFADLPDGEATFKAARSAKEDAKVVERAIEKSIADESFVMRPILRPILFDINIPFRQIRIKKTPKNIEIQHDDSTPVRSAINGKVKWTNESGTTFDVTQTIDNKGILQTYDSDDGAKILRYRFRPDFKSLVLTVTLKSQHLETPLVYSLLYKLL